MAHDPVGDEAEVALEGLHRVFGDGPEDAVHIHIGDLGKELRGHPQHILHGLHADAGIPLFEDRGGRGVGHIHIFALAAPVSYTHLWAA